MSEYWRPVPAGTVSIVYESPIEYGPLAGEIGRTEEPYSVRSFEISAVPLSNRQFAQFVHAEDGWRVDGWWRYHLEALIQRRARPKTSASSGDDDPVTQISYWDSLAFCHWYSWQQQQSFSLPRESEYQAAIACGAARAAHVFEWCRPDRKPPMINYPIRRGDERLDKIGQATQPDLGFRAARYAEGDVLPFRFQPDAARVSALLEALHRERSFAQRCKLIDELGLLKATEAVEMLIAVLTSATTDDQAPHGYRPWIVRESAAQALGSIGDARAIPALLAGCRHDDLSVSFLAGRALGRLGNEAYSAAAELLTESSDKLRRLGTVALTALGDPAAINLLIPLAEADPVESVRRSAQGAIDQLRF